MLFAAVLSALALGATATTASAGIWTPINSGTTSEITAIEYQSDTRFWFTTSTGAIFTRQPNGSFVQTLAPTFVALNDIESQNGGNVGLSVEVARRIRVREPLVTTGTRVSVEVRSTLAVELRP